MWTANILTLFPNLYPGPLGTSILGEAKKNGKWKLNITDLKQFAEKKREWMIRHLVVDLEWSLNQM